MEPIVKTDHLALYTETAATLEHLRKRWEGLSQARHPRPEQWLVDLVERRLIEGFSADELALAVKGALQDRPAFERAKLTLGKILASPKQLKIHAACGRMKANPTAQRRYTGSSIGTTRHGAIGQRVDTTFSYATKAQAKKLGCKWDQENQVWYFVITEHTPPSTLKALEPWVKPESRHLLRPGRKAPGAHTTPKRSETRPERPKARANQQRQAQAQFATVMRAIKTAAKAAAPKDMTKEKQRQQRRTAALLEAQRQAREAALANGLAPGSQQETELARRIFATWEANDA